MKLIKLSPLVLLLAATTTWPAIQAGESTGTTGDTGVVDTTTGTGGPVELMTNLLTIALDVPAIVHLLFGLLSLFAEIPHEITKATTSKQLVLDAGSPDDHEHERKRRHISAMLESGKAMIEGMQKDFSETVETISNKFSEIATWAQEFPPLKDAQEAIDNGVEVVRKEVVEYLTQQPYINSSALLNLNFETSTFEDWMSLFNVPDVTSIDVMDTLRSVEGYLDERIEVFVKSIYEWKDEADTFYEKIKSKVDFFGWLEDEEQEAE